MKIRLAIVDECESRSRQVKYSLAEYIADVVESRHDGRCSWPISPPMSRQEPVSGRKTATWRQPDEVAKLTMADAVVVGPDEFPMMKGACEACCEGHAGPVPCVVIR